MKFFKSVKFRLTVWYLIIISILLFIFATVSYFTLYHNLYQNLDDSLEDRVWKIRNILENTEDDDIDLSRERDIGEAILVYRPDGVLLHATGFFTDTPDIVSQVIEVAEGIPSFFNLTTTYGWEIRFYAAPISVKGGLVVVVGRYLNEITNILARLRTIFVLSGLVMVVLAGIGGLFLADRVLRPVDRITRTAQKIGESDLSHRIEVQSEDELGRLASTLNQMMARIENAFLWQQQFAADASHELRTPLSVIQAEATLALEKERKDEEYKRALGIISQEVTQMSSIIDKLLFLARSDIQKEQYNFAQVDIRELIVDLATTIEVLAYEKGLRFELGKVEKLLVKGDKEKLKQLLFNILDNAIKYTSHGRIFVSAVTEGTMAVITIADTGIGIPPQDLPRIFDRFYRVDKSRSRGEGGSGLGLAIAQTIVESHEGKINVKSQPGKGTTFSVLLPLLRT